MPESSKCKNAMIKNIVWKGKLRSDFKILGYLVKNKMKL